MIFLFSTDEPAVTFTLEEEFSFFSGTGPFTHLTQQPSFITSGSPHKASSVKKIRCDLLEDTPRKPLGDATNLLLSPVKRTIRTPTKPVQEAPRHLQEQSKPTTSAIPRFYFPKNNGEEAPLIAEALVRSLLTASGLSLS